jgi:septum formation topological specificity factor MinE
VNEREAVLDAIRKLQHQHYAMEFFGARTDPPIETCLDEVRRSDVLVVIVGHRYGNLVPEMGISFSEAEYREGYRLGKPCLVYLRDENVPILPKFVERDPEKIALLDKFRNVLQTRHTIATFKDFHDLSVSVAADLSRTAQALEKDAARMEREPISRSAVLSEINEITDSALGKGLPESIVVSTFRHAIASLLKEQGKRNPLVFCSYSHSNKEIVKAIASGLRDAGIDVWIDEKDVTMGIGKADTISKGLDIADFLLFFISRHSTTSEWAIKELDIVISRRLSKPRNALILPVLLEDVEVPALLRDVKYLDLRDGNVSRTISDLVKIINRYSEARSEKIAKRFIGYAEKRDEIIFNLEQRIGESLHLADQIRSSEFAETIRKWIEDDYARINDITEMTKTLEKTFEEIISLNSRF